MNIEDLPSYPNLYHDGWQELIGHEEEGMGSMCVTKLVEIF